MLSSLGLKELGSEMVSSMGGRLKVSRVGQPLKLRVFNDITVLIVMATKVP
jgi:hypothetical protein